MKKPETLRELLGQVIGQASMQWEFNDRGGVYQSDQAVELLEQTMQDIKALGYRKKKDETKFKPLEIDT